MKPHGPLVIFLFSFTFVVVESSIVFKSTSPNDIFGSRLNDLAPLIVGGEEVIPHSFPWMLSLRVNMEGKIGLCGGTLIGLDLVLTAAHCVYNVGNNKVQVLAGKHDLLKHEETEQSLQSSEIKYHENYNSVTLLNDIALVRLSNKFNQTSAVKVLELPPKTFNISDYSKGTVAGWGTLSYGGPTSSKLQKVSVPFVNNTYCNSQYSGLVTDNQFCAGEEGKDSCQGDSGGPFLCTRGSETVLCGVVSFGNRCAEARYPGVYIKISSYLSWIEINGNLPSLTPSPVPSTSSSTVSSIVTSKPPSSSGILMASPILMTTAVIFLYNLTILEIKS